MYYHDHVISRRVTNKDLTKQRTSLYSTRLPADFWDHLATYFIHSHGINPTIDGRTVGNRSLSLEENQSDTWEQDLNKITDRVPGSALGPTNIDSSIYFLSDDELEQYLYYILETVSYFLK